MFISQPAHMMPRCSGLKKQKTDASVIKTIKAAAAPSAVVRDCSDEQKKESKRDFLGYKVEVCRYVFSLIKDWQIIRSSGWKSAK